MAYQRPWRTTVISARPDMSLERCQTWVRMYHSATDVASCLGLNRGSIARAVRRHGLQFRLEHSLAEDPPSDAEYLR
jgi:hypothetical protein